MASHRHPRACGGMEIGIAVIISRRGFVMSQDMTAEEFDVEGLKVKIEYDFDPQCPRKEGFGALGVMACRHSRRNLGDEDGFEKLREVMEESPHFDDSWNDPSSESYKDLSDPGVLIALLDTGVFPEIISLPLYLYDHSGLTMNTTGFSDPWDSSMVGVIFITEEVVRKELLGYPKLYSEVLKDRFRPAGEKHLKQEVEVYDVYLRGEVYGFTVSDEEGEELDSCWGYYGLDHVREDARRAAHNAALSRREESERDLAESAGKQTGAVQVLVDKDDGSIFGVYGVASEMRHHIADEFSLEEGDIMPFILEKFEIKFASDFRGYKPLKDKKDEETPTPGMDM